MQQTSASFKIRVPIGKNLLTEELSQIFWPVLFMSKSTNVPHQLVL